MLCSASTCSAGGLVGLPKRRLLALTARRGERIESVRGSLWLTQDDDRRDLVLAPGEAHVIERDGPVLVQALDAALVSLHRLPATPTVTWWKRLRAAF